MDTHSLEPWIVTRSTINMSNWALLSQNGQIVVDMGTLQGYNTPNNIQNIANVQRIAACINALKGIPTRVLEGLSNVYNKKEKKKALIKELEKL